MHVPIINTLLQEGVNINAGTYTHSLLKIQVLLDSFWIMDHMSRGTLLSIHRFAFERFTLKVFPVSYILEAGADPEGNHPNFETPIHHAPCRCVQESASFQRSQ